MSDGSYSTEVISGGYLPIDEEASVRANRSYWDNSAEEYLAELAVDSGFTSADRQVGQTGVIVSPNLYIALGISGAIQHLQGIGACDKVVAVNMDPGCDMIKRADLSVIGDSAAILAALIERVAVWRQEGKRDAA